MPSQSPEVLPMRLGIPALERWQVVGVANLSEIFFRTSPTLGSA